MLANMPNSQCVPSPMEIALFFYYFTTIVSMFYCFQAEREGNLCVAGDQG